MSASALAVVAGLVALAARFRSRGGAWSLAVVATLCVALSSPVLELLRAPASWRDAVAFALLGAGAWLSAHPRRPHALSAIPLMAAALQPLWLPAAVALAAERFVASLPSLRRRALLGGLGLAACLGAAVAGGQQLLARSLLAFRESLLRPIPDARHESFTLITAIAVLLVVALLARSASAAREVEGETPAAFWLAGLAVQLLVLGHRPPAPSALAALPLLMALGFVGRASPPLAAAALAGSLAVANGLVRSSLTTEPVLAGAERARAAFQPDDLLVFPDQPSFELEYYAERSSVAFADLGRRGPSPKPLDVLSEELGRRRVWLAVDDEGRPPSVKPADAARLLWGVTVAAGGLRMRELRAITSASPCSTPATPGAGGVRAGASGFVEANLGRSYAPERAVDGDPKTEWLAAPGAYAWLDLSLREPRAVRGLRLLDAQNLPHRDFETRLLRAELHGEGGLLGASELALAGGQWRQLAVRGERVVCVRLLVLSHRGRGGGLAEVELY